jgi:hypothetical protein
MRRKRRREEEKVGNERRRMKRRKMKQEKQKEISYSNLENICAADCKYIFYARVNFRTMHIQNDKDEPHERGVYCLISNLENNSRKNVNCTAYFTTQFSSAYIIT